MRVVRRCSHFARRCFGAKSLKKDDLSTILCRQIRSAGPISVADYMKIAMHHPVYGYYNSSSVLGPDGDFITSPEISQIFGEALCKFPTGSSLFRHLHFVERSDRLREIQESVIFPTLKTYCIKPEFSWHSSLDEVPGGFDLGYAICNVNSELMMTGRKSFTIAASTYLPLAGNLSGRNCVEVCPEAGAIVQKLASRIATDGGSALISDYGHLGECGDTLRAFKDHKLHDPLKDPGQADITADVDFAFLRRSIESTKEPVICHGPVSQAYFLVHMGILLRLKVLVEKTELEKDKKRLIMSTEMLIGSNQMGKRFKFMALTTGRSKKEKEHIPGGFYPTWDTDKA
ncbi:Protein arginine methyltransferase NDUFAF7 mitochondrial [Taenia crassiceps]|uniref:Protein arginine methyltransferase NDUFAF7 n=1 Tax=Taenia crassiceps TaxID=6207 RepID=A0ABR4QNA7_9CEST